MRRFATATALAMIALLVGSAWLVNRSPTRPTPALTRRDSAPQDTTDPTHKAPSDTRRRQAIQSDARTDATGWPVAAVPLRQGLLRFYPPLRVQVVDGEGEPVPDIRVRYEANLDTLITEFANMRPVRTYRGRTRSSRYVSSRHATTGADGWAELLLLRGAGDGEPDITMWAALNPSESNLALSRQRTKVTFDQPGHLVLHRPSSVRLTVVAQDRPGSADNTLSSTDGPLLFELQTVPEGAAVPRSGATPAAGDTHVWSRVEPGLYRICARSPRLPGYGEVAAIEGIIVPIGTPCTDSRLVQWDPYRKTDLAILDIVLEDGTRPGGCYVAIVIDGVSRTRKHFDLNAGPVEVAIPQGEACLLAISADDMRQTIIDGVAGSHRIVLQRGMPASVRWTRSSRVDPGMVAISLRRVPDPAAPFNIPWHETLDLGIGPGVGMTEMILPGPGTYRFRARGLIVEPSVVVVSESALTVIDISVDALAADEDD